jgi:hypothetical protein
VSDDRGQLSFAVGCDMSLSLTIRVARGEGYWDWPGHDRVWCERLG